MIFAKRQMAKHVIAYLKITYTWQCLKEPNRELKQSSPRYCMEDEIFFMPLGDREGKDGG